MEGGGGENTKIRLMNSREEIRHFKISLNA